jgi:hypothetical protein
MLRFLSVHFLLVMVSFAAFVCSFPCVAFSGCRLSGSSAAASCRAFLPLVSGFGGSVGVGCAWGVDSLVRSAFPSASVFRVGSFLVGGRVARASFALRSSALVRWCAARGGLLVAFPLGACPSGVAVSSSFRGCGSGSWGSVALALGLGCSVLVVLPAAVCPVGATFPAPAAVAARFGLVGAAPCGGSLWLACPTTGVASPVPLPVPSVGGVQLALF